MNSRIQMVFFDLDGTLLPMDMDEFIHGYFGLLAVKAAPYGYESKNLIKGIWHGIAAMVGNDGTCMNEDAFWKAFAAFFGDEALKDKHLFEEFYANEFRQARQFCGYDPKAEETVSWVKKQGLRAALATNPLYPSVATESRIRWAGLEPEDFEFYTTFENIGYCKPNPAYYREIMRIADLTPEACVMVGNDVGEDMIAAELGMRVFLLTDWLVNKDGADISRYPHGSFDDLKEYLLPLL